MAKGEIAAGGLAEVSDNLWRRRYAAFVRLYKGRDDVIAERQNGEYVALKGAGLTFERFRDHVLMRKTYAVYNMDDAGRVNFGLFDVDVLQRDRGWDAILPELEEKRRETALIMQTLTDMGLQRRNMLLEFPTVGYHLLIFFDEPVPAKALKTLMGFVLERCGLASIPFYPRKVADSPWGDRAQLPLRINLNTSKRSNFIRDLDSFDPVKYDDEPDYSALEEVVLIDAKWVSRMMEKYDLK
jgi:hypothetical protein